MKKTLTKADIVEAIYEETDKNRVDVKNVVEKLLEIMKTAIKKDRSLLISGFGKFECYDKPRAEDAIRRPMKPSLCRRARLWSSGSRGNFARNSTHRPTPGGKIFWRRMPQKKLCVLGGCRDGIREKSAMTARASVAS